MATGDDRRRDALVRAPVRRLQRHLNRTVWLQALVVPIWGSVTAFAVWRFMVRFQSLAVGVLLAAGAIAYWIYRARKHRVSDAEAAVRADRLSDAGGLLLTRLETRVGEWELELNSRVRGMKLPSQPVRRPLSLSMLALLFLAAVLFVPAPPDRAIPKNAAAANKLAEVEARAEALAKEEPLEGSIEAELAKLREELQENRFDAVDWEAADGLDSAMAQKAAEAAEELRKAEEAANSLEQAMAKAGEGEGAAREQEALEKALMDMSDGQAQSAEEALQQAMAGQEGSEGEQQKKDGEQGKEGEGAQQQSGEGSKQESKEGQQQNGNGQQQQSSSGQKSGKGMSRSKLSDLQKALQNRQQQLQKSFGQQQGDQKMAGQGQGEGQKGEGQGQGQGQGKGEGKEGKGKGERGGPSRGGGEGQLSFDDDTAIHPERLAFEALPQGQGGDPDELWGLKSANPKKGTEGAKQGLGNGEGGVAVGDQSPGKRHEQMLPRNRELVRRYFGGE